ncbi:GSCFA domain-containing protein [Taibaiella sp. KBW10]|uniref:GSCFA domain-containing protein n=1 Tax=Taibaiella sp. KBW10 TaxID=2153357 RepID=UPI001F399E27|nr:GSCFA domain-containing protein [Taibaiella sp. KBW10]
MLTSLPIQITAPQPRIEHQDKLLLLGSCFTEHIGKRLAEAKFSVLENPNGILFNPLSVVKSISSYIQNQAIAASDLFSLNEIWNHWDFHTRFSDFDKQIAVERMNASIGAAHQYLQKADWLIVTLGSAFQYFLHENEQAVANCHRAPGQWFEKRLLSIALIQEALKEMIEELKAFNPDLKIIFTISPVRHIRDGVVENNRSKARLIEAVHEMTTLHDHCFYFPAYELVIDVLRDYRYYDIDLVHPNFAATNAVWEQFFLHYLSEEAQTIATKMQELSTAKNHKVRFPETNAYTKFRQNFLQKIAQYQQAYPYIDFEAERRAFLEDSL